MYFYNVQLSVYYLCTVLTVAAFRVDAQVAQILASIIYISLSFIIDCNRPILKIKVGQLIS